MASASLAGRSPDAFELPASTWGRSQRPPWGTLLRFAVAGVFVGVSLLVPGWPLALGALALGLLWVFVFPRWVERRLEDLGHRLAAVPAGAVPAQLRQLEETRLVAMFAPYAWVQIQRARLLAKVPDGRGAAAALGEAVRMCGGTPANLLGLQADALLLGGDRKGALQILRRLERDAQLGGRDRVNLGVALLDERGALETALEHLQEDPAEAQYAARRWSALAVGLAKKRRFAEAREAFAQAEACPPQSKDGVVADLLKRASKGVREAPEPRPAQPESEAPKSEPPKSAASKSAASKSERTKSSRKERREQRKSRKERKESGEKAKKAKERSSGREKPQPRRVVAKNPRQEPKGAVAKQLAAEAVGSRAVVEEPREEPDVAVAEQLAAEAVGSSVVVEDPRDEQLAAEAAGSRVFVEEPREEPDVAVAQQLAAEAMGPGVVAEALGETSAVDVAVARGADPQAEKWLPPKVEATTPSTPSIEDDPWAELVASDDDEIRPA